MNGLVEKVEAGTNLDSDESRFAMNYVIDHAGEESATDTIRSFLIAMQQKGPSIDELVTFATVMKQHAILIEPTVDSPLVDNCGTGADQSNSVNVSTGAAVIAASAGVAIAKLGSPAISSRSGSVDVLRALGYHTDMTPEQAKQTIEEQGIAFMQAIPFFPYRKRLDPIRKTISGPTLFNVLGPLVNPANVEVKLAGVYDERLCTTYVETLRGLGLQRALVVHGSGLDEISVAGPTIFYELRDGNISNYVLNPSDFKLSVHKVEQIQGGDPNQNAEYLRNALTSNSPHLNAVRDVMLVNAGAIMYVSGFAQTINEGVQIAREAVSSGAAAQKLTTIVEHSQQFR